MEGRRSEGAVRVLRRREVWPWALAALAVAAALVAIFWLRPSVAVVDPARGEVPAVADPLPAVP